MAKHEIEMIVCGTPLHNPNTGMMNSYGQQSNNPWGQSQYGMGSFYGPMGMMSPQFLQPYAQYYGAAASSYAAYMGAAATDGKSNNSRMNVFSLYF